jgi:anti-sigma factor ChrR (cupin superfamily)
MGTKMPNLGALIRAKHATDKKPDRAKKIDLYVVDDEAGSISKPKSSEEALTTYDSWTRQGGRCRLYRLQEVDVELVIKG